VPTTVVMMVPMTFSTLNTLFQLIFISHSIILFLKRSHRFRAPSKGRLSLGFAAFTKRSD
jgi:hypothetical protein